MTERINELTPTLPPLRDYWRAINRKNKETQAEKRARRKATDKNRPKCRCAAYPFPHRPGARLCRWPDPPSEIWQRKVKSRPYRTRYAGLRRQIARANGLHPIKDRALIDELMPGVIAIAKQLKRKEPRIKYRNMEITDYDKLAGYWTTAGPMM